MSKEDIQTIIKEIKKILKYTAKSFLYIYSGIFLIYTIFINIFSNMLTNNNFFSNLNSIHGRSLSSMNSMPLGPLPVRL